MQRWKFDFKFHIMSKAYQRKCSFIRTKNISKGFICTNINKVSNYILYLTCVCNSAILPELNLFLRCGIKTNRYKIGRDISICTNYQILRLISIQGMAHCNKKNMYLIRLIYIAYFLSILHTNTFEVCFKLRWRNCFKLRWRNFHKSAQQWMISPNLLSLLVFGTLQFLIYVGTHFIL